MIVAGIDYSLNSPAIAVYDTDTDFVFANIKLYNLNAKKKYDGRHGDNIDIKLIPLYTSPEQRFKNNADWALDILIKNKVEMVVLEGYAYGSSAGLVFQIAENCGILKQWMHLANIPFHTPSPPDVKKAFSGSGRAKKEDMVGTFESRFEVDVAAIIGQGNKYTSPCNDLVDAVAMLNWGIVNKVFVENKENSHNDGRTTV